MPITLIQQNPDFVKTVSHTTNKFAIAEMFGNTIQGEGINAGIPATFIRLQGCTLACHFCDTLNVWPNGNEYSFDEVCTLFEYHGLIDKFYRGQHIIWTGGSPLKQQDRIVAFTTYFCDRYGFKPYYEIENEVVLQPSNELIPLIDCWNNSPKLSNSGMKKHIRVKPDALRQLTQLKNAWFKFVISSREDWNEIETDFLPYIHKRQIILMPCGQTREELNETRELTIDLAIKHDVRFSDRAHVVAWNKKTGV